MTNCKLLISIFSILITAGSSFSQTNMITLSHSVECEAVQNGLLIFTDSIYNYDIAYKNSNQSGILDNFLSIQFKNKFKINAIELDFLKREEAKLCPFIIHIIFNDKLITRYVSSETELIPIGEKIDNIILYKNFDKSHTYDYLLKNYKIITDEVEANIFPQYVVDSIKQNQIENRIFSFLPDQKETIYKHKKILKKIVRKNLKDILTNDEYKSLIEKIEKGIHNNYSYVPYLKHKGMNIENSIWYLIDKYDIVSEKLLNELQEEKVVGIEDLFFKYSVHLRKELYKPCYYYKYSKKNLDYNDPNTIVFLRNQLKEDHDSPASAIQHLCLLNDTSSLENIYQLGFTGIPYSKWMAVRGMIYFKEYHKAKSIINEMVENDLESISKDSIGVNSFFLGYSLIDILRIDPGYALPQILSIYKAYRNLYPPSIKYEYEHYNNKAMSKKIRSIGSVDRTVKEEVLNFIQKYPHSNNLQVIKELQTEFKKEITVLNKW